MAQPANVFEAPATPTAPRGFVVRVFENVGALPAHWPRSGFTSEAHCHVFQTVEFLQVWAATFGRAHDARPLFVEITGDDGALALLAPFELLRKGGARVLTFADDGSADYNAPVLFPSHWDWTPELAAGMWQAVKAALPPFDVAILDKMPADVGGVPNPFHMLADAANPVSCHYSDLQKPWAEVEDGQPHMRTLKKRMRALDRVAPTQLLIATGARERDAILIKLLEQKQRRFEDTKVPGFDANPEKRAFFTQATEIFAGTGALTLSALMVGDEIVATMWGLTHCRRYYGLVIGNEAGEWAKFSPGRILYHRMLRWLHERGVERMDVGIGDETWKLEQCDVTIPLAMKTEPVTWRGRLYIRRTDAMRRLRASPVWERIRPLKWIVLRNLRKFGRPLSGREPPSGSREEP